MAGTYSYSQPPLTQYGFGSQPMIPRLPLYPQVAYIPYPIPILSPTRRREEKIEEESEEEGDGEDMDKNQGRAGGSSTGSRSTTC